MTQKYQKLTAGDIRQPGDEVRRTVPGCGAHPKDDEGQWRPVSLIGHEILKSDLTITKHCPQCDAKFRKLFLN